MIGPEHNGRNTNIWFKLKSYSYIMGIMVWESFFMFITKQNEE